MPTTRCPKPLQERQILVIVTALCINVARSAERSFHSGLAPPKLHKAKRTYYSSYTARSKLKKMLK